MFDEVKDVMIEALNLKEEEITLNSSLRDDLGVDSLDAAELIMELEDQLQIKIDEAAAAKFATVKDIVDFVESAKNN
ncbi:MAG: acyl carrier protein [Defluviitaleaceae bacterium]|nr:acyl carrier protein [Defluviitaleaceae bacterium]